MSKRVLPTVVLSGLALFGLVACGDDDGGQATSDSVETLPPAETPASVPVDTASGDGFTYPTGADDVVIEYAEVGGFVPVEVAFAQTPSVLVSGDGQLFSPGAVPAIYPGPLLPAVQVQTITDAGIQQLLAAADEAGLLADVDYEEPMQIADASTARVTITVDGETYVHEAYALGLELPDEDVSPERQALAGFVEQLMTLSPVDPGELGDTAIFEPAEYGLQANPIDDLTGFGGDGIEPTVIDWPADSGIALADATTCTVVDAKGVGATLTEANQLTFFDDGGQTYQVLAKPILPGSSC